MQRTAVQFGAGNIGRGFITELFHESGLEVVFVDVIPAVLKAIRERRSYRIHIVGPDAHTVHIDGIRAVDGRNRDEAAREIARCEIACTAVGVGALPHIAPNLAAGLALRDEENGGPLSILVCENLHDADTYLCGLVASHLPEDRREAILRKTGFVQAVVSRMVPLQNPDSSNPLDIKVEAYKRLPVNARAMVGVLTDLVGVEPVGNFEAHVERKLYTHNCAHAVLGYLGYERSLEFGYQALEDGPTRCVLDAVMEETGAALVRRHGFDPDEHRRHVADLMDRFANVELGDTCFRLARDPLRKLAPDDRLVGAARLCESQDVEPKALATAIGAALRFSAPEDPSAAKLQEMIANQGIDSTLQAVCGIRADEPLGLAVLAAYREQ